MHEYASKHVNILREMLCVLCVNLLHLVIMCYINRVIDQFGGLEQFFSLSLSLLLFFCFNYL